LEVCRTGPCCLRGAEQLIEHIQNKFGIQVGQTSPDGMFTLKTVECLAACGGAPCLQVRLKREGGIHKYYENLTPEKLDELVGTEWA
jgi:NADH-quinone oxidoreductase subunit E